MDNARKFYAGEGPMIMSRLPWIITIALIFAGCAADNTDAIKKAIKGNLPMSYKVEYGDFQKFPRGVVCGEYTPIGRFDVPEKVRSFIYVDGEVEFTPSQNDTAIFCSKNQEKQLQSIMGIEIPIIENTNLLKIYKDLVTLDEALGVYRSDNRIYPVTAQGLQALVSKSETYPRPQRFRDGGYLKEVPQDPWGRPYAYTFEEQLRGEPMVYSLYTLGKDGKEGGKGENADINSSMLKYLKHILEN